MRSESNMWALILAAGEGTRLRALTTAPGGTMIPKQFWSFRCGPSLLGEAVQRARAVALPDHICAVVAKQHRCWWEPELETLLHENVIVQPANRGTAIGMLLPLLHIAQRDPEARIVLLPSDHHVRREAILSCALRQAAEQLHWRSDETVLLGLEAESPDPQLGYIMPGRSDGHGACEVLHFVEKPPLARGRELVEQGGLWNAFIVASTVEALLALLRRRIPEILAEMYAAVRRDLMGQGDGLAVAELYDQLPSIDFSHDILPGQEAYLRVLRVAQCGWSDLGTPERVAAALSVGGATGVERAGSGYLNLAAQHERLRRVEGGMAAPMKSS
jgi:mannose-1-phosphate guanylyltransferase